MLKYQKREIKVQSHKSSEIAFFSQACKIFSWYLSSLKILHLFNFQKIVSFTFYLFTLDLNLDPRRPFVDQIPVGELLNIGSVSKEW